MAHVDTANGTEDVLQVPFSRVATFVRQITHDVRNSLNSMDLQAAYATELVTDPEAAQEVKRIRALIQTSARQLQGLSSNFQISTPSLVHYQCSILMEDFQERLAKAQPELAGEVVWEIHLQSEILEVDVEMFFSALLELFKNAGQFRCKGMPLTATVSVVEGGILFELLEGKTDAPAGLPESWGRSPFVSSRRSSYGLGLFRVRRIMELHQGELKFSFDPARALLVTCVWLPLAQPS